MESSHDSIDDMVNASTASGTRHDGETSLDDYSIKITGVNASAEPDDDEIVIEETAPRRRGRPAGSTTKKEPAKRKSEVVADNERLQAELAALRSRTDTDKISELAKSIEMATYLAFGWAGEIRGPHWGIQESEAKDIGASGAVAMAPHADWINEKLPWFVFAGTLGKALFDRVKEDRRLVKLYGEAGTSVERR